MDYLIKCLLAMTPCYKWFILFMFISFIVLDKVWKYFPPIEKWYYEQSRDIQLGCNTKCPKEIRFNILEILLLS